jgi:hypothetical protein
VCSPTEGRNSREKPMSSLSRTSTATARLAAATLLTLATSVHAQVPPPPQCATVDEGRAAISIDSNAVATPDCLEIVKNKVEVDWTGGEGVAELLVRFDEVDGKKPLDDPDCSGAGCHLDKLKAKKAGEFKYSITVTRADGSSVTVDPLLIIKN